VRTLHEGWAVEEKVSLYAYFLDVFRMADTKAYIFMKHPVKSDYDENGVLPTCCSKLWLRSVLVNIRVQVK
jgi:hypothetical protein